jgi:hypothetical protein
VRWSGVRTPGDELRDSARRMIYWVMKERWATSGKKNKKARPDFLDASRYDVSSCLECRIFSISISMRGTKSKKWLTSRTPNWIIGVDSTFACCV